MIYRIRTWEQVSGEHRPVGEMVCEISADGRAKGAFRYEKEYLERKDAFPMDPVSLPLTSESFTIENPGIFSAFEDSLPDDWGRRLLVRKHHIPRHEQNLPNLLIALGSMGLGALSYTEHGKPEPPPKDVSTLHLAELVDAAEKFESGEIQDSEISLLLGAGSSPGGARPKVIVLDEDNDIHYLAKFPSLKDHVDVVKIESATMSLAAKAGLTVPPTKLVQCGHKSILLVKRFDIVPGGRQHMISFLTLLRAQGFYQLRYKDLLEAVRKYSNNPIADSELLFRQMVFNAIIGNTDDHLKNFWMLYDRIQGWRLSPAFDLVPDIGDRGEHVLFFDLGAYYPGRKALETLGRKWGISNAANVIAQVFESVSAWKEEFSSFGVSESDINRFRVIDKHISG